jgi:hypothetical protein
MMLLSGYGVSTGGGLSSGVEESLAGSHVSALVRKIRTEVMTQSQRRLGRQTATNNHSPW